MGGWIADVMDGWLFAAWMDGWMDVWLDGWLDS